MTGTSFPSTSIPIYVGLAEQQVFYEHRAWKLLEENVGEILFDEYEKIRYVMVEGQTGLRYQITDPTYGGTNVRMFSMPEMKRKLPGLFDPFGHPIQPFLFHPSRMSLRLCAIPENRFPAADQMLIQAMWIRNNERYFLSRSAVTLMSLGLTMDYFVRAFKDELQNLIDLSWGSPHCTVGHYVMLALRQSGFLHGTRIEIIV